MTFMGVPCLVLVLAYSVQASLSLVGLMRRVLGSDAFADRVSDAMRMIFFIGFGSFTQSLLGCEGKEKTSPFRGRGFKG